MLFLPNWTRNVLIEVGLLFCRITRSRWSSVQRERVGKELNEIKEHHDHLTLSDFLILRFSILSFFTVNYVLLDIVVLLACFVTHLVTRVVHVSHPPTYPTQCKFGLGSWLILSRVRILARLQNCYQRVSLLDNRKHANIMNKLKQVPYLICLFN